MTDDQLWALARKNVAGWPPLTPEQRDRLHVLLAPMREWLAADHKTRGSAA